MVRNRRDARALRFVPEGHSGDTHDGKWVAVRAGKIIASAETSQVLQEMLTTLRGDTEGVVMQFVRSPIRHLLNEALAR